jgi:tetratricopeptide (TPR) repeat protein
VLERRLAHLSEDCRALLVVAAVIGREFNLEILRRVVGANLSRALTEDQVLELLTEAAAARLLTPVPHAIGRYSFSHALIRETLYEALPLSQCAQVHEHIGETLENLYGIHPDPHLTELAHRFFLAAQGGGNRDKAIDYARRAGERAMTLLAYEEAAGHYARALQVLGMQNTEEEQRCELLLALGEAWRKAADLLHAREAFQRAAESARALKGQLGEHQVAPLLARAALGMATGFAGVTVTAGTVDSFVVGLLEEALHSFAEEDSELKARVLGRLAVELYWSGATERRTDLCRQAVAMARRVGDAAALAYTLNAKRIALWGPEKIEERLRDAAEVVQLAEQIGDREMALRGQSGHITDLIELGDFQAADHALAGYARQAEDLRQPFYLWLLTAWKAMRAGLEGRFTEAEGLARQALAIGQKAHDSDAVQYFTAQIIAFRGGRGLRETETPAKGFVEQYLSLPAWRCGLALIYADTNRKTDARREFEYFAMHDFANLPRDREWLGALASLAQVCAFLGDAQRAALLYERLLPHAKRYIVVGPAIVCLGSAARFLGLLAMTMGRWDDAQAHFEDALQGNTRIGAHPLVAWTQVMYARMLVTRAQAGASPTSTEQDVKYARHLLAQALTIVRELGMDDLEQRVCILKSQVSGFKFQVQEEAGPRKLEASPLSSQASSLKPQILRTPPSELRTHLFPLSTLTSFVTRVTTGLLLFRESCAVSKMPMGCIIWRTSCAIRIENVMCSRWWLRRRRTGIRANSLRMTHGRQDPAIRVRSSTLRLGRLTNGDWKIYVRNWKKHKNSTTHTAPTVCAKKSKL